MSFAKFIASKLTEAGKVIRFKNDSVLQAISSGNLENKEVFKLTADKIQKEVNDYFSKIQPIYRSLVEYAEKKSEEYKAEPAYSKYKIKEYNRNAFLESVSKQDNIGASRQLSPMKIERMNIGTPETPEELRKLFTYDVSSVDELLKPIRDSLPDSKLEEIWTKYVAIVGDNTVIQDLATNMLAKDDILALVYTAYKNLIKSKPIFAPGDEAEYAGRVKVQYNEIANLVAMYKGIANVAFNKLIISYNTETNFIGINAKLYTKYLEAGGRPEAVLAAGALHYDASDTTNLTMEAIVANQDKLIAEWNELVSAGKVSDFTKKVDSYKAIYQLAILDVLKHDITDSIRSEYEIEDAKVVKEVTNMLAETQGDIILDIDEIALRIVGCILFPCTNYEYFSRLILKYVKELANADANVLPEAIRYAVVELITDYVLGQTEIGSK